MNKINDRKVFEFKDWFKDKKKYVSFISNRIVSIDKSKKREIVSQEYLTLFFLIFVTLCIFIISVVRKHIIDKQADQESAWVEIQPQSSESKETDLKNHFIEAINEMKIFEKRKVHETKEAKVMQDQKNKLTPVTYYHENKENYRVSSCIHTSTIGTTDNPTFDGGIINSADGIPVYQQKIPQVSRSINRDIVEIQKDSIKKSFVDDWTVSNQVKSTLQRIAQSGQLNYVLKQSEQKGIPASVVLLPILESNYQDNAVSPKGAVGSWQLMPSTALLQGMNPSQRIDFVPETNAALNYLNELHQQFGNWVLTYAAYNAGSTRVINALIKNPNATSIDDLDLPIETKKYVEKLKEMNQLLE